MMTCRPADLLAASPVPASGEIQTAIAKAQKYLLSLIGPDGMCDTEYGEKEIHHGGRTALVVYALVETGVSPTSQPLAKAVEWLARLQPKGTYATSLRAMALASVNYPAYLPLLQQDVRWLVSEVADSDVAAYDYTGKATTRFDNSNSQMAALAVYAGMQRGVQVPREYWQKVEKHWTQQQQDDGGWSYRRTPKDQGQSYGSMTAAGLATMFMCYQILHGEEYIGCDHNAAYEPAEKSLAWLDKNYASGVNPGHYTQYYHYWLYSVDRVARAGGLKYFGGHNWFNEGAEELLETQTPKGYWMTDPLVNTSMSLLFLGRGRRPVAIGKLRYGGLWNSRPRDAANFAQWVGENLERPVSWQVVDLQAPLEDWHESPILYLSGAGRVEFTEEQLVKLRTFCLQGGLLLSEAACNDYDFTASMQQALRKMFPEWRLIRLDSEGAINSVQFPNRIRGLLGVSNGIRVLAIHCPQQMSLALEMGPREEYLPVFRLMGNIFLSATDKGTLRWRGDPGWPSSAKAKTDREIRIARLKHDGTYDPEPMAWQRLAILMAQRDRIQLTLSPPMDIEKLDARQWSLASFSGASSFTLSEKQKAALRKYFQDGGTIIADAAGASSDFNDAVQKQLIPLVASPDLARLPQRLLLEGPEPLKTINYRRDFALKLGVDKHLGRMVAVSSGRRIVLVHSPDDVTTALLGLRWYGIKGYDPDTVPQMMTNLLSNLCPAQPSTSPSLP